MTHKDWEDTWNVYKKTNHSKNHDPNIPSYRKDRLLLSIGKELLNILFALFHTNKQENKDN